MEFNALLYELAISLHNKISMRQKSLDKIHCDTSLHCDTSF